MLPSGPAAPLADGMNLGQAARTAAFWLMLVAVAAGAGGMTAMFTHVVPILTGHGVGWRRRPAWWRSLPWSPPVGRW
jgi:predicted MFS family arabinose efflux permease